MGKILNIAVDTMSMRKCWPPMLIGDLFVVASTQEEDSQLPDLFHRKSDNWFHFLSRCSDDDVDWATLHQGRWPNSKQTNHPLGGRYQPITCQQSQMTSQSATVCYPLLPKLLILIFPWIFAKIISFHFSCPGSNTSSFHLFVLTDALACLTEGKTDWTDFGLKFRNGSHCTYSRK